MMFDRIAAAMGLDPAAIPPWVQVSVLALVKSGVLLGALLTFAAYAVWAERRLLGLMQGRPGPNRVGPFGLLQPLADVLKLFTKEETLPPFADRVLFLVAPALIMFTSMLTFAIVPFGEHDLFVITDANVGVLLFLAFSSLGVYSIVFAGWSSNSKYSVLGGLRATAQMISYELPMGLSALAVVMLAGSFSLQDIVRAQSPYYFILINPLGFMVFLVSVMAESRRTPFDLPEAENELVAGFHTEYSSMKFALFFLGEYVGVVLLSAIIAVFYLGGWHGPWIPGPHWMLLKTFALVFLFIWVRATMPRFRYDHLMTLGWKWLIPLSILNVIVTAALALLFPGLVPNAVR